MNVQYRLQGLGRLMYNTFNQNSIFYAYDYDINTLISIEANPTIANQHHHL